MKISNSLFLLVSAQISTITAYYTRLHHTYGSDVVVYEIQEYSPWATHLGVRHTGDSNKFQTALIQQVFQSQTGPYRKFKTNWPRHGRTPPTVAITV